MLNLQSGRVRNIDLADGTSGEASIDPGADDPFVDLQDLEEEMRTGLATADQSAVDG